MKNKTIIILMAMILLGMIGVRADNESIKMLYVNFNTNVSNIWDWSPYDTTNQGVTLNTTTFPSCVEHYG